MAKRDRRGAEKRGRYAEALSVLWLRLKGYSILATRLKLAVGEIDIIAQRGNVLAFIEVKFRTELATAQTAVTGKSWARIARAADVWTARHPSLSQLDWRYDLIAWSRRTWPRHYRDYWRP
ncbi:MAG: YraN family protein [Pseudomonadota bacterium]